MPGIVNDVSATFVATMHSLLFAGAGRNTWTYVNNRTDIYNMLLTNRHNTDVTITCLQFTAFLSTSV